MLYEVITSNSRHQRDALQNGVRIWRVPVQELDDYLAAMKWIPSDGSRADNALLSMSLWKPPASLTKDILASYNFV